jgi:hypothetical protein
MTKLNARRLKQGGTEPFASPPDNGTAPSLAEGSEAARIWATTRVDYEPNTELHREEEKGATEAVTSLAPSCRRGWHNEPIAAALRCDPR